MMQAVPGLLMKAGAEGVHAAALADGRAIALKIADGHERARTPVLVAALRRLGVQGPALDRFGAAWYSAAASRWGRSRSSRVCSDRGGSSPRGLCAPGPGGGRRA